MSIGTYFGEVAQKRRNQGRPTEGSRTFYCWAQNKERCDVFVSKEPGFDYKLALDAWGWGGALEMRLKMPVQTQWSLLLLYGVLGA